MLTPGFSVADPIRDASSGGVGLDAGVPALTHPKADPAGWQPVPLISEANRDAGERYGGEGGQWVQTIAIDQQAGDFVIYGTDVAGVIRSLDGGVTWEPTNVGLHARGGSGAAIDPNFPDRVVIIGVNSMPTGRHGVYLSENRAASWEHVLPINMCGIRDIRDQMAFDPNTADAELGLTRDVYWSRPAEEEPFFGTVEPDPSIYRSGDGGRTWERLEGTAHVAGGVLRVDPHQRGRLLACGRDGLYVSEDRGESWDIIREGTYTGLDVSPSQPGLIWLCDAKGLYRSTDGGETFDPVQSAQSRLARDGYTLRGVEVSPADPDRLLLWRQDDDGWNWAWFVSHNAGHTWQSTKHMNQKAFLPQNGRQGVFAWHPTDPDVVIATGGDWPTRSRDGGQTFPWSARGFVGNLVSAQFHFNPKQPGLLFLGSQDYSAALTQDGGRTWRYVNVSGRSWGGFSYGAHAVTPEVLIAGDSGKWAGARRLNISRDGGETWERRDDVAFDRGNWNKPDAEVPYGFQSAFACPDQPDVWFFGPHRSTDAGKTWSLMPDCDGVHNLAVDGTGENYTLVGHDYDQITGIGHAVVSDDHGASWTRVLSVMGRPIDAAYDVRLGVAYMVTSEGELYRSRSDSGRETRRLDPPRDQFGNRKIRSVALDPRNPRIVYVAQNRDVYAVDASAMRSVDGGDSWEVLTRQQPLGEVGLDGGRESFIVRVHPVTRDAWFGTGCYGTWRYPAPAD